MKRKQIGFALLDVLLAWAIFMVTLLSLLAMQIDNVRHARRAYFNTVAVVQLQSMAERLRANTDAVSRLQEKQRWNSQNQALLPVGEGDFHCQSRMCTIDLHWEAAGPQVKTLTVLVY